MMKKYKWSLLLGSLLSLSPQGVSSAASDVYKRQLQMAGAARQLPFSDFRFLCLQ